MSVASTTIASEDQGDIASVHAVPSLRGLLVRLLAALFLICLFVPLAGAFFHWDFRDASNENRNLAEIPQLPKTGKDVNHYTDAWLDFYRDHFGFRNALIHAVAASKFHDLAQELNGNVLVGQDGWLFLRPDGDHDLIAFRGLNPFTDAQLDAWQGMLERRQAFLASLGIPYVVVIAPDKQTIYPEYLPPQYAIVRHESRLDQLVNRLKQTHSPVQIVDLRPALVVAKNRGRLYQKTDTHWDDLGAYIGYRVIMDAVQTALPSWQIVPQPWNDFTISPTYPVVGDLARMIGAPEQYPDQTWYLLRKITFPIPPELINRNQVATMDLHDPTKPNLIFYRDSFSIALVPLMGPNFDRVVYAFKYEMDPDLIRREKPHLVISEFIERNLYIPPPTDAAELRDWNLHRPQ